MKQSKTKITALYSRLSCDDQFKPNDDIGLGESNSITNQKKILEDYATKNGFKNLRHFYDDGVSGTTFERKGFKEMIAEIENDNVSAVIVKDMSRLGRDYLGVGYYTEVFFRQKNVRFIAVSNNIDSDHGESSEFAPFLNIMSEWYARDTSRKIKATWKNKGESGKRLTSSAIYGYQKDPNDKENWLVDPVAAKVVKRIFSLSIDGKGPYQIAKILEDDCVENPSSYLQKLGFGTNKNRVIKNLYAWSPITVSYIISKSEYCGHTVNFRYTKPSYKEKKQTKNPKEDWLIFRDTHEAIIDEKTWELAQKSRTVKRRTDTTGVANPLTGLLYCADCGKRLYNHRRAAQERTDPQTGKIHKQSERNNYCCPGSNTSGPYKDKCGKHYISDKAANALILETIRRTTDFARENEQEFAELIRETSELQQGETTIASQKQIAENEQRIAKLDTLFRKTYEDYSAGKLSEKRFEQLSQSYESEQSELVEQTEVLKSELAKFEDDTLKADKFVELARKYIDITELTPAMLNEFVDKVIVHQADRSSGKRTQKVDIYLNYVGNLDVPLEVEEVDTIDEQRREEQRAKWREYKRRERARKKTA